MSRLTETLCQLVADLEAELETANECWHDARAERDASKQELDLLSDQLKAVQSNLDLAMLAIEEINKVNAEKNEDQLELIKSLQEELQRPQQDLQQYLGQIRMLENQINTLKNTPPVSISGGPRDNLLKALPGYGEVLASALLQAGWTTKQIDQLETVVLRNLPTHAEWYADQVPADDESEAVAVEPPDIPDAAIDSPVWNKRRTRQ